MAWLAWCKINELVLSDTRGLQGLKGSDFDLPCHLINDVKAATVEEASYYGEEDCMVLIMAGSGFAMGVKEQGTHSSGPPWLGRRDGVAHLPAGWHTAKAR